MAVQIMYRNSLVIAAIVTVLLYPRNGVQCEPLCLTGDFDSQLQHILHKRMLSTHDAARIISRVFKDVETTLNKRWRGFRAIPFGSLTTGLGTISSDVDLYIQLPNFSFSAALSVLRESHKLFKKQPRLYTHLIYYYIKTPVKYTSFQFLHIPSGIRKVDLVFEFGEMGVANSKLVKYYFRLDKRFLPLGRFLKFWFEIQRRNGHVLPKDYALYMFIIFYLQQKNMVPSVYELAKNSTSHFIHEWDVGFNELQYRSHNTENLYQLIGGFFKFYSEFNFKEYVIAPYAGRPIRKRALKDVNNFPKEYSSYKNGLTYKLQHKIKHDLFYVNYDVCLQDPFIHSLNAVERTIPSHFIARFQYLMKSVATMFEVLPSESVLKTILAMGRHKHTVNRNKKARLNVINRRDCIEVRT